MSALLALITQNGDLASARCGRRRRGTIARARRHQILIQRADRTGWAEPLADRNSKSFVCLFSTSLNDNRILFLLDAADKLISESLNGVVSFRFLFCREKRANALRLPFVN